MRVLGCTLVGVASLATAGSMFLPWFKFQDSTATAWEFGTGNDIALVIVCVASAALALAAALSRSRPVTTLMSVTSAALFGIVTSTATALLGQTEFSGYGTWVAWFTAAVALAGGTLAALSLTATEAPSATALPAAIPPAGWYPDPASSGGERYWDGSVWTPQAR